jgi:hypothetical protein
MNRVAIGVALLLTTGANAGAENCTIPTDDEVQARTAQCLLSVDSTAIISERCNFRVSPDGHSTTLDAGKYYAEVNITSRGVAVALWNRGSGRSDQLTSLGSVTPFDRNGAYCYRNRRFELCASNYLTCKCGPDEQSGCKPPDAD